MQVGINLLPGHFQQQLELRLNSELFQFIRNELLKCSSCECSSVLTQRLEKTPTCHLKGQEFSLVTGNTMREEVETMVMSYKATSISWRNQQIACNS
jgi:hypothetical protein